MLKILKDKQNAIKSQLQGLKSPKLTKTYNESLISELQTELDLVSFMINYIIESQQLTNTTTTSSGNESYIYKIMK
jgi:hypothetical protein